jgi:hypothetical protein
MSAEHAQEEITLKCITIITSKAETVSKWFYETSYLMR